ncbi:MAG: sigma-E factor negative regulatory protein [Acidiferrobacterales bacterium]
MKENLSALMDGELSEDERAHVLAELTGDPELTKSWERYHLIRAALRKEFGPMVFPGLGERVAAQIGELPAPIPTSDMAQSGKWRAVGRWTGGLALAASVVAMAMFGPQWFVPDEQPSTTAQLAVGPDPQAKFIHAAVTQWDSGEPDVANLLNSYLVEHNEYIPTPGMKGVMSYGRFVSYDNSR